MITGKCGCIVCFCLLCLFLLFCTQQSIENLNDNRKNYDKTIPEMWIVSIDNMKLYMSKSNVIFIHFSTYDFSCKMAAGPYARQLRQASSWSLLCRSRWASLVEARIKPAIFQTWVQQSLSYFLFKLTLTSTVLYCLILLKELDMQTFQIVNTLFHPISILGGSIYLEKKIKQKLFRRSLLSFFCRRTTSQQSLRQHCSMTCVPHFYWFKKYFPRN